MDYQIYRDFANILIVNICYLVGQSVSETERETISPWIVVGVSGKLIAGHCSCMAAWSWSWNENNAAKLLCIYVSCCSFQINTHAPLQYKYIPLCFDIWHNYVDNSSACTSIKWYRITQIDQGITYAYNFIKSKYSAIFRYNKVNWLCCTKNEVLLICRTESITLSTWLHCLVCSTSIPVGCFFPLRKGGRAIRAQYQLTESWKSNPLSARMVSLGKILSSNPLFSDRCLLQISRISLLHSTLFLFHSVLNSSTESSLGGFCRTALATLSADKMPWT